MLSAKCLTQIFLLSTQHFALLKTMFCPKCGTQNPETGRFCRSCGADLGNISEALSGKLRKQQGLTDRKGKPVNYEGAITKMFTGLAFLIVALVLGYTGIAGGQFWWFWMLIPAFGSIGSGVAQYVQLKKTEGRNVSFAANNQNVFNSAAPNASLPPPQSNLDEIRNLINSGNKITAIKVHRETFGTGLKDAKDAVEQMEREMLMPPNVANNYGEPPRSSVYDTGELTVPPSVTENTTRHLEINSEGETMTLPKNK